MSLLTIHKQLVKEGMSYTGALAMVANMDAESALLANNLQDCYNKAWGISDAEYCRRANAGNPTNGSRHFENDGAGFGLYQLTEASRKRGYYLVAREQWGVPIEDEECQVWYCCYEFRTQYKDLWKYLQRDDCDLETAVGRICREFERPAEDNSGARYKRAISRGQELKALYAAEEEKAASARPAPLNLAALADRFRTLASEFTDLADIFSKAK